jgi:hypothetical protein
MNEGLADFLASLALPNSRVSASSYQRYGRTHEAAVWRAFRRGMATREDSGHWLYNYGTANNHGAADLGYFVGFRICEAFYNRASDKRRAIRELIVLRDPAEVLRRSGYVGVAPQRGSR